MIKSLFPKVVASNVMLVVGGCQLLFFLVIMAAVYWSSHDDLQKNIHEKAVLMMTSLEAMHSVAMLERRYISDDTIAITVFDETVKHFSEINSDFRVWLVMGPSLLAFQQAQDNEEEHPADNLDVAAIDTKKIVTGYNEAQEYRVAKPSILGQGSAQDEGCFFCHGTLMKIKPGEVIGVLSLAYDTKDVVDDFRTKFIYFGIFLFAISVVVAVFITVIVRQIVKPTI